MPLGVKIKFKPKITSKRTAGATEGPSHLRTPPGQGAQVAFATGPESPWSPNHAFFPLKALSQLCSVTNSITNVTQFVWQDVIFFYSRCFSWSRLSRRHSATPSRHPAGPAAQLDGWFSPQLFPLQPALLSPANPYSICFPAVF